MLDRNKNYTFTNPDDENTINLKRGMLNQIRKNHPKLYDGVSQSFGIKPNF